MSDKRVLVAVDLDEVLVRECLSVLGIVRCAVFSAAGFTFHSDAGTICGSIGNMAQCKV